MNKYGPEADVDASASGGEIQAYYGGVGMLLKKKLIDPGLAEELMGTHVVRVGEYVEPVIQGWRKQRSDPYLWEEFEYAYEAMKKIRDQRLKKG